MIVFITCNTNLVPLLEGLCSSNPCRFEFSVFFLRVFAGIEPTTLGLTVLRSDQLRKTRSDQLSKMNLLYRHKVMSVGFQAK